MLKIHELAHIFSTEHIHSIPVAHSALFLSCHQAFSETLLHKTHELRFEKKRSDKLLYQMLPSSVAQQLRIHKAVAAETYSSITIYFSDIVGFSEMAYQSTPMQVSGRRCYSCR